MKNRLIKTLGYLGASFALFACGEHVDGPYQLDTSNVGEATYSLERDCLSESALLFDYCHGKKSSDKACVDTLKAERLKCQIQIDEAARTTVTREHLAEEGAARLARGEAGAEAPIRGFPANGGDEANERDAEARDVREAREDREDPEARERPARDSENEAVRERPARDSENEAARERPDRDSENEDTRPTLRELEEGETRQRPQSCEAACRAHAHEAFIDCVDSGREARDCRAYASDQIELCIEDRCVTEEAGTEVEPATCAERCQHHGRDVYAECVDSGRRNVTCRAYAGQVIETCIENRCESTEVETDAEVEANTCRHRARAAFEHCRERGGSQQRCHHMARRAHHACVDAHASSDESEESVDVESQPGAPCLHQAKKLYIRCLENGGSRLRCSALAKRLQRACKSAGTDEVGSDEDELAQEDDAEVSEGDVDVENACNERAREHFQRCGESSRDRGACGEEARNIYERCADMDSSDESAERPTDHDVDLNTACGERARHLYASCIENGGEERRCGAIAHRSFDECVSIRAN